MADTNEVKNPFTYFGDPTQGKPLSNAIIYVGEPEKDSEIAANRKIVQGKLETGATVPIPQPIRTGAGGYVNYQGSQVQLVVDGEYSLKVLDRNGKQVSYTPSLVGGVVPSFIVRTQKVGLSAELPSRVINATLYATNTSFQQYYDAEAPAMDLGDLDQDPFTLENIPTQRFDLSQGNSTIDLGVL